MKQILLIVLFVMLLAGCGTGKYLLNAGEPFTTLIQKSELERFSLSPESLQTRDPVCGTHELPH